MSIVSVHEAFSLDEYCRLGRWGEGGGEGGDRGRLALRAHQHQQTPTTIQTGHA